MSIDFNLQPIIDSIFSNTQLWIVSFGQLFAIGIAISIAISLLLFLGQQLINAFRDKATRSRVDSQARDMFDFMR